MKALLISESLNSAEKLKPFLGSYNFEIIHYRSPVKVIDNLQEISPNAVIINALDFPRHWKVITQHLQWENAKGRILIILLTGDNFSQGDSDKAFSMGIQGTIKIENGDFDSVIPEMKKIFESNTLSGLKSSPDDISKSVQFLFTNPLNEAIVTGKVNKISDSTVFFTPDAPANISGLEEGTVLDRCSLKLNNILIVPVCKIVSAGEDLELALSDLSEEDKRNIRSISAGA